MHIDRYDDNFMYDTQWESEPLAYELWPSVPVPISRWTDLHQEMDANVSKHVQDIFFVCQNST